MFFITNCAANEGVGMEIKMKKRIKRELKNLVIKIVVYLGVLFILSFIFKTELSKSSIFVYLITIVLSTIIFRIVLGKDDE